MAFQTDVKIKQAFGVVGELYDTSIRRVTPYKLAAASKIGRPAWLTAEGKATGTYDSTLPLIGIFVNPKEYTHKGNVAEVTLEMTADSIAQVADLGHVNVLLNGNAKVGQDMYVLVEKGSAVTLELGTFVGADAGSTPEAGSGTSAKTWVKVGKCVRAGGTAGEIAVLQIAVA